MRITGQTVVRRYMANLERNFSKKNRSENKISSNAKYNRASESPIEAAKALKIRKSVAELKNYESNLNTAKGIYESAESAVMKISELIQSTYEKLIYGANGTQSNVEDEIISESIATYADEMVRLLNISVADRTIFGGTSNTGQPFTIQNGAVFYNGVSVNEYQDPGLFPNAKTSYTDIGIGMTLDSSGRIDQQSALPVTFNGVEIMGCGLMKKTISIDLENMISGSEYSLDIYCGSSKKTIVFQAGGDAEDTAAEINDALEEIYGFDQIIISDNGIIANNMLGEPEITVQNSPLKDEEDEEYEEFDQAEITTTPMGFSKNIIQLTLDAAACLKTGDKLGAAQYADALFEVQTSLSLTIADIGNKEEFIDFNLERITNNLYSMYDHQNNLEGTDLGTEITNWKVLDAIYNATLQMSASVMPMSIFNFMN